MSAPTLRPDPTVEVAEHDGQLVYLRAADLGLWYILPPNYSHEVGPFVSKEVALAVAACHFSHGEAF